MQWLTHSIFYAYVAISTNLHTESSRLSPTKGYCETLKLFTSLIWSWKHAMVHVYINGLTIFDLGPFAWNIGLFFMIKNCCGSIKLVQNVEMLWALHHLYTLAKKVFCFKVNWKPLSIKILKIDDTTVKRAKLLDRKKATVYKRKDPFNNF